MTTWTVGTGQEFSTVAAAVAAAQDGDTVQVQAGTYVNDFAEISHKITLEGVGGMVKMVAQGLIPNGKGILITDTDITIDHFAFSGATVGDGNGAGIRYQGGNLTLTNDSFTNDQNGLLSAADPNGSITLRNSYFADDGSGDGHTHDIYVGAINALTIDNSLFTGAVVGHEIKSRAASTVVTNSRVEDGPGGTASYDIDLPNGGNLSVSNTVIEKAATAQNPVVISYGEEGVSNPGTSVTLSGDTVLNDLSSPSSRVFVNDSGAAVSIQNLATFGLSSGQLLSGPGSVSGWTALATEPALNLSSPIAASTTTATPSITSTPTPTPTGTNTLVLYVSEDAYLGDAQFTISVDGVQVGGVDTATASHAAGQSQAFTVTNTLSAGPHIIGVNFLNDRYDGTASTDRNLYVGSAAVNGVAVPNSALTLLSAGPQTFSLTAPTGPASSGTSTGSTPTGSTSTGSTSTGSTPTGSTSTGSTSTGGTAAPGTLVLYVSEDAYQGDAQFTVSVDGTQVGGIDTATASHAAGQTQAFTLPTLLSSGTHRITVNFLNDLYDGTASTDRNLYVNSATLDGATVSGSSLNLLSGGPQSFSATESGASAASTAPTSTTPAASTGTAPAGTLILSLSEDAYQGDAQFTVSVDGKQAGGVNTVTASHAAGQVQAFTVPTTLAPGVHSISVKFLNDAYGGTPSTDRNLFVNGATLDGKAVPGSTLTLLSAGAQSFTATEPAATSTAPAGAPITAPITSTLVLNVAEQAYQGNAQIGISIDGTPNQAYVVTASQANGQTQAITISGIAETFSPHDIAVSFIGQDSGGTPATTRALYVDSATFDGRAVGGLPLTFTTASTQHLSAAAPANWTG